MTRICLLAHLDFVPLRDWATYLRDRGHAVRVLSLSNGEPIPGIPCECLRRPQRLIAERTNWQHLLALPGLWARLRREPPALLIAMFASSNGVLGALLRARSTRLVIRVTGADLELRSRQSWLLRRVIAHALQSADAVVSPAAHLSELMARELGVDPDRITTLQSGIRIDAETATASREPLCLCARQMVRAADIGVVIDAFRRLGERGSPLRLELAHDGPQRARLEHDAADLIASGQLRFSGRLAREELCARLRQCAIYVSMKRLDGTSTTLLEAMAAGALPVVCDIAANRAWITHGDNGLLVPLGDAGALAAAIDCAWWDHAWRERAARRNREIVAARADFDRNMATIESVLLQGVVR